MASASKPSTTKKTKKKNTLPSGKIAPVMSFDMTSQNPGKSKSYAPKADILEVPSFTENNTQDSSFKSTPADNRKLAITLIFIITMLLLIFILLLP